MAKGRDDSKIFQIPKDAVKRADLGQSFAEYDFVRTDPQLVVETPALIAAASRQSAKSIFVGRRGAGKTAITYSLEQRDSKRTILLLPQLFSTLDVFVTTDIADAVHQRSFKTLVSSFRKSLLCEVTSKWLASGVFSFRQYGESAITREKDYIEQDDFDLRTYEIVEDGSNLLAKGKEKEWHRFVQRTKELGKEIQEESTEPRRHTQVLIDRIDEDWNGSDRAVVLLMALMHAAVELNATQTYVRFLLFVRENMFDRVRKIDSEWSRIETAILSLEWTRESLRDFLSDD